MTAANLKSLIIGKVVAILRALFGVFVFVALMSMIFTLFASFCASRNIDYEVVKGTYNFIYGILVILALLFYIKMTDVPSSGDKVLPLIRRSKINWAQVVLVVVLSLGLLGMVNLYMTFISSLAQKSKEVATVMEDYSQSTDRYAAVADIKVIPNFDHVLNLIAVSVIVPFAEELVFRAIVFGELRKKLHPVTAVILSSAIFGVMHGNGLHIVYAFVCGLMICLTYWFCDSIWASYIVHALFNFFGSGIFVFMQSGILGDATPMVRSLDNVLFFAEYMFMLPSLACIVFLGMIYRQNLKKNIDKDAEVALSDVEQA